MYRIAVFISAALLSACADRSPVQTVTVRDAEFALVKELNPGEIVAFNRQWNEKADAKVSLASEGGVHFKIDVNQKASNNRWLYYTSGLVTRLDYEARPVYRVPNPAEFNQLIGAKR